MKSKVVRKTIELLLDRAEIEEDFKVVKYTIDDYTSEGYNMNGMYPLFHEKYKAWKEIKNDKKK